MAVVDTGVLIAAFNRRDSLHRSGLAILAAADEGVVEPLLLHDFVLAETLNYLVRKAGSLVARDALRRLERSDGVRLLRLPDATFSVAKNDVFPNREGLSFVDALTVAYMQLHRVSVLYSFDSDFDGIRGIRRRTKP